MGSDAGLAFVPAGKRIKVDRENGQWRKGKRHSQQEERQTQRYRRANMPFTHRRSSSGLENKPGNSYAILNDCKTFSWFTPSIKSV